MSRLLSSPISNETDREKEEKDILAFAAAAVGQKDYERRGRKKRGKK